MFWWKIQMWILRSPLHNHNLNVNYIQCKGVTHPSDKYERVLHVDTNMMSRCVSALMTYMLHLWVSMKLHVSEQIIQTLELWNMSDLSSATISPIRVHVFYSYLVCFTVVSSCLDVPSLRPTCYTFESQRTLCFWVTIKEEMTLIQIKLHEDFTYIVMHSYYLLKIVFTYLPWWLTCYTFECLWNFMSLSR